MNAQQLIQIEAIKRYPVWLAYNPQDQGWEQDINKNAREQFIEVATFGLSLQTNEWVRVTPETMPEKSGQYLGCESWNKTGKPFIVYFDREDDMFYQKCTHWMPLPTPPSKYFYCRAKDEEGALCESQCPRCAKTNDLPTPPNDIV
jgi:hypothetical protein